MKKRLTMPANRALLGVLCYSAFALTPLVKAQETQISAADLEFIEQLGSLDEDQEALQAAMSAYSQSKQAASNTEDSNEAAQAPSSQKAEVKP